MKKMPCLFQRVFSGRHVVELLRDVTPGCEWVLAGEGKASRKWDGTACMVKDGVLYKRYDAKRGKTPPVGAIPCDDPDPVTGHWPHWVRADPSNPADKWHHEAWLHRGNDVDGDGTYELIGPHFNGDPERTYIDNFRRHGDFPAFLRERSYDAIREFLDRYEYEGIVFAHSDGRMCKIRRVDYGLPWPIRSAAQFPSHVDIQDSGGIVRRFGTGDRLLWRNMLGIGGILVAARISGMLMRDDHDPSVVALDIEPSEPLRLVLEWAADSAHVPIPDCVARAANGGRIFIAGDEFMRAVYDGKIRHAATDDEGRAKDNAALAAMPDWWATRREDLAVARRE